MLVQRYAENPIITPEDVKPSRPDLQVWCVFNAGVIRAGKEVLLLLRVAEQARTTDPNVVRVPYLDVATQELVIKDFRRDDPDIDLSDARWVHTPEQDYLSSISHLRLARSRDGLHFEIDDAPALFPVNVVEMYGIEDARITRIVDMYWINYSAVSPVTGVTTCLASTHTFRTFRRLGIAFPPDNKDVTLFPDKGGSEGNGDNHYALHRPSADVFQARDIWIAESPDMIHWGNHRLLMQTRAGMWDEERIGAGAVPILTDAGWLEIYHGADRNYRYCLGAVLLDRDSPWKVLARSEEPILVPETDYEFEGVFGNVVFTCGALLEPGVLVDEPAVKIYYGAADTVMAYAEIPLQALLDSLR